MILSLTVQVILYSKKVTFGLLKLIIMGKRSILDTWSTRSNFSKPVNMPRVGSFVKQEIYDQEMSVPALAKRLNVSAARAYRMIRRNDWRVSEIMNVSMVININLFAWYAQQTQAVEPTAELRQRIAELEKENEKLKMQLEIWKEAAGVKKAG